MTSAELKKGRLLIAEVALTGDMSFSRSVVFLAEYNKEGAVGFILNKTLDFTLPDLLQGIQTDFTIFKGGPVDQDNLYYLHKIPDRLPGSLKIADGLYWGGDFKVLYEALKAGEIAKDEIMFFMGYSGWMPQQLEVEIENGSWLIFENNYDILTVDSSSFWKEKMEELGGEYLLWSNSPEDPRYN